jgi:hypothetical protein
MLRARLSRFGHSRRRWVTVSVWLGQWGHVAEGKRAGLKRCMFSYEVRRFALDCKRKVSRCWPCEPFIISDHVRCVGRQCLAASMKELKRGGGGVGGFGFGCHV